MVKKIGKLGVSSLLPPLGLAYIAAVLERAGHEVEIIDGVVRSTNYGYSLEDLQNDIALSTARVVGITATTPQIGVAIETIKLVKEVDPEKITILGGPHISSLPETLLKVPALDYGVFGEGELTMLEIVDKIARQEKVEEVAGVIYRDGEKIEYRPRPFIQNLDELPFPARHLLPMDEYHPAIVSYRRLPASQIITSRGCPFRCRFCHKATTGYKFRVHSPDRVLNEMESLIDRYGVKDIQIFDDAFTIQPERVKRICEGILERKLNIGWSCLSRADSITPELVSIMKEAGCYQIGMGVESGSPRILKLLRKDETKEQIKKAVEVIQSVGIEVRAFFMIGIPTETKEEVQMTIDFAKELNPGIVQFLVTTPYPGTDLWKLCEENGSIQADDFSTFTMYRFDDLPYLSDTISPKELVQLYRSAHFSYYMRPRYIVSKLKQIKSFADVRRYLMAFRGLINL